MILFGASYPYLNSTGLFQKENQFTQPVIIMFIGGNVG
ncbi:MAG: hypothetical protein JWQ57_2398 [Mucilaginibacter sp.]|nr:hypothetical protein [Mucilaginibacter sp.]